MFFHKATDQISHQLKMTVNKTVQQNVKCIPLLQAIYFYVCDKCQSLHHIQGTVLVPKRYLKAHQKNKRSHSMYLQ